MLSILVGHRKTEGWKDVQQRLLHVIIVRINVLPDLWLSRFHLLSDLVLLPLHFQNHTAPVPTINSIFDRISNFNSFKCFYRPQRSWAKVMFLQASVILSTGGGGVCLSAWWDPPWQQTPPPGLDPPPVQTPPRSRPPPGADTPPGSRCQHTVNERPVRILLECILVHQNFTSKLTSIINLNTGPKELWVIQLLIFFSQLCLTRLEHFDDDIWEQTELKGMIRIVITI